MCKNKIIKAYKFQAMGLHLKMGYNKVGLFFEYKMVLDPNKALD